MFRWDALNALQKKKKKMLLMAYPRIKIKESKIWQLETIHPCVRGMALVCAVKVTGFYTTK